MATFSSPGVYTQENDFSFLPQSPAAVGGLVIGLTKKGPAFLPTVVNNFNDFRTKFGGLDPQLYVPYTAKNYLQNSDTLTVTRILQTTSPTDTGQALVLAFGSVAQASGGSLSSTLTAMAILRARSTITTASITGTANNFDLKVDSTSAAGLSLNRTDANYIGKVLGTDPFAAKSGDSITSVYVDTIYDYAYFASAGVTGSVLAGAAYASGVGGYSPAKTPVIVSQNYNGSVYDLFYLETLSDGDDANDDIKVSITMDPSQNTASAYPTFTVLVRDFNDTDDRQITLESFVCNLDPGSEAYIKRVIGDRKPSLNTTTDPPEVMFSGDYENRSKYVRIIMYDGYPPDAKPSGFKAIPATQPGPVFKNPYKFDHLNFASVKDTKIYMGFDSAQVNAKNRLGFLTTGISATSATITKGFLVSTLTAENSSTASLTNTYELVNASTGNPATATTLYNALRYTVPFYGGWDGIDKRKDKLNLLADGTISADYINAIKLMSNPDEFSFNLVTLPGLFAGGPATQGSIPSRVIEMVTNRGDAFYIMDIGDNTLTTVTGATISSTVDGVVNTAKSFDTNYAGSYFPSVRIFDQDNNKYIWVPTSVVMMGAYAFNDKVGQPWFAPAGLNRGVLNVFEARKRLTQAQRDTLQLGKVNPIATFSGQGIVAYGQKTLQVKASALDRVNVRRLLITSKKIATDVAKFFAFEPNNALTRSKIVNELTPPFEDIQKKQGLNAFKIICDATNNPPDLEDRNILAVDIQLNPTRTAEIIQISFNINRGSVEFT